MAGIVLAPGRGLSLAARVKTKRRASGPQMEPSEPVLKAVIGHQQQVTQLRAQIDTGAVAHSYWISGPEQVGKTTLALALAGELLQAQGWPGGLGNHPDLWLDQEEGQLGIDRIRGGEPDSQGGPTLQHFLSLSSFAGRGKVAVIGDAERLTLPAANSLLRLLEEPPDDAVLCLCTSRPDSEHLPATLRSRCQQLLLGPVESGAIGAWLTGARGFPGPAAELAAALAQGRPGLALQLASDPELTQRTESQLQSFLGCAERTPGQLLELSRELAERGAERGLAEGAMRAWAAFLRDCCSVASGAAELSRLPGRAGAARLWADRLGLAGCLNRYDLALDALARLAEASTPRLVLDRFLLLTFSGEGPAPPATRPPR